MPVISNKITPDSVVYTDHWHSYNALDVAGFSHIESIIQAILLMVRIISMELKTFGIRQKECFENTMVLTEMPFHCLLKMRSTASQVSI
jgi:transposase-like protein